MTRQRHRRERISPCQSAEKSSRTGKKGRADLRTKNALFDAIKREKKIYVERKPNPKRKAVVARKKKGEAGGQYREDKFEEKLTLDLLGGKTQLRKMKKGKNTGCLGPRKRAKRPLCGAAPLYQDQGGSGLTTGEGEERQRLWSRA